jgi:SAM-dependent methyltransferase
VLLQSPEEWQSRNEALSRSLGELRERFAPAGARYALDIGCQHGTLTETWAGESSLEWVGVDPRIVEAHELSPRVRLLPGSAEALPFADSYFDVVMLANVYEHIPPGVRATAFREMRRVLATDGVIVGQIPNPYFPIESHSRLPFMGWLPIRVQKAYWHLSPVPWEHDFFVVTLKHLRRDASAAGLQTVFVRRFNYPLTVIPQRLRWAARFFAGPMRVVPWAWQFVLAKRAP